jgi:hypothetical protein
MNILIDGLPTAIQIGDKVHEINADYQTGLRIVTAFEDNELTAYEKCAVLITLLYKESPADFETAIKKGVLFLDCGEGKKEEGIGDGIRKYSFIHDSKYIFSGVDRVLHGRLSTGKFVHWWEFVMAFMELPEDCMMSRIIYLRTQYAKNKLTREERQQYNEMRDIVELPLELTSEEEAVKDKFMKLIGKG